MWVRACAVCECLCLSLACAMQRAFSTGRIARFKRSLVTSLWYLLPRRRRARTASGSLFVPQGRTHRHHSLRPSEKKSAFVYSFFLYNALTNEDVFVWFLFSSGGGAKKKKRGPACALVRAVHDVAALARGELELSQPPACRPKSEH